MEKIEKITIKLLMLLIGFSLLFPVRALAAEKDEITEKKQIIFLLDASKSMQGDGQWIEAADSACISQDSRRNHHFKRGADRGQTEEKTGCQL